LPGGAPGGTFDRKGAFDQLGASHAICNVLYGAQAADDPYMAAAFAAPGTAGNSTCATGNPGSIPNASGSEPIRLSSRMARTLAKGPYVAETFPVHVEGNYVIVEI
jgi:hypothetical protein